MTDTPNCANEAAGMANIRTASSSKRMLRILNHLARSPVRLPGPTLASAGCLVRGLASSASLPRIHFLVCALWITLRGMSQS